jgi:acetyl esterase
VRIYTPNGQGPFPLLLWFHGGGWVLGSVKTHDATCRRLAGQAGCCVVSVDYRLAPEAKFPAAVEDCYAATRWAAKNAALLHADPRKIAVGGESAGGNLAASVALLARDQGDPSLVQQVLVYPVIERNFGTPSYRDNGQGYWLTRETMEWFWGLYLRDEADATDPRAAPILARSLAGLPPALVITAEFDPLRDEGEAYAQRLADAGVPTARTRYNGLIHGFFGRPTEIDKAKEAVAQVASALKAAFAR